MEYTKPPPTTTQLRGEVFNMMVAHKKQIAFFKTLIDDEEGQSPFEGIENSYQALYEAFMNF